MRPRWAIAVARSSYLWIWERASTLAAIVGIGVISFGVWRVDQGIRDDLHFAVLNIASDVEDLLFRYDATQALQATEILELCRSDLESAHNSLQDLADFAFFQAIHQGENVYYDSRTGNVAHLPSQVEIDEARLPEADQLPDRPLRYVDHQEVGPWLLRAGITGRAYAGKQLWGVLRWLPVAALGVGMLYFPHYYRDSISRRQFEILVRAVLDSPQDVRTEDELLKRLPDFVRKILDLDWVILYRVEEQCLELVEESLRSALRHRETAKRLILLGSSEPEARAAGTNETIKLPLSTRSSRRPFGWLGSNRVGVVIEPISSKIRKRTSAVLRFEHFNGIEGNDLASLQEVAQLVGILIDNVLSSQQVEETYSRMVRLTRKVAMATVVPIVAHNLRTPLTMISFIARDLKEKRRTIPKKLLEERLQQVENQTHQCLQLIDKIIQYRRIGYRADASPHRRSTIDLINVLGTICDFFDAFFEIRQIRLVRSFAPGFRPFVKMEELDLLQVITNLLINADEAFPETDRGTANCTVHIRVHPAEGAQNVVIRVSDNGSGIPSEVLGKLFEEHVTTKPDGTGAGLPYCRAVVESAGGTLALETEQREGASFRILLPTKAR